MVLDFLGSLWKFWVVLFLDLLEVFGSFRKFLEVFGSFLKFSEVFGSFLKVLEVFRSFGLFVVFLGG